MWAFQTTDNFTDCLIAAVNRGHDSDTTGAVAGMLAGAHYGYAGIPAHFKEKLLWHDRLAKVAVDLFFRKKIKFDIHDNNSSLSGVSYTKEIMLISLSENKMKKIIATTFLAITFAATAEASCFGTKAFMTCSDGNSYSTIGNTTFGSNSNTGSSWSQTTSGNAHTAHPVMGRAGTAITTGQAAGVPTAEVIPGAALELSAISNKYQLGLVGVRLAPNPLFLDASTVGDSKAGGQDEEGLVSLLVLLAVLYTGIVASEDNCQFSGKFSDLSESRKSSSQLSY